jgi:hypothetical protein
MSHLTRLEEGSQRISSLLRAKMQGGYGSSPLRAVGVTARVNVNNGDAGDLGASI